MTPVELVELVAEGLRDAIAQTEAQTLVMAVSGGVDSIAIMHVLASLRTKFPIKLVAVHVHHGLRDAADRDASLVREFADLLDCAYEMRCVNVPAVIRRTGESVETGARRLRYEALLAVASAYSQPLIVTAHHQNDQAETVLDHLMRGSGLSGLVGIVPLRHLHGVPLWRPLLQVSKQALAEYVRVHSLPYAEDETNAWREFRRNRIRHELLPFLAESFNPAIVDALARAAEILRAEDELLAEWTVEFVANHAQIQKHGASIEREAYLRLPLALQRRVVKLILEYVGYGFPFGFEEIEAARRLAQQGRGERSLKGGQRLIAHSSALEIVEDASEYAPAFNLTPCAMDRASFFSVWALRWQVKSEVVPPPSVFARTLWEAWFTLEDQPTLVLRQWRRGDRIAQQGIAGSKLLSDVFVDHKVPRKQRSLYPVFTIDEEVVWVPGLARSRSHLIRNDLPQALRVSVRSAMED